jgi:hypothetical protein
MPEHIVAVGLVGIPVEIFQAVVGRIAIPVTADEPRRSRTNECLENELVNESSDLPAVAVETDDEMAPATTDRLQRTPGLGHLPTPPTSPSRLNFTFLVDPVSWESDYISK